MKNANCKLQCEQSSTEELARTIAKLRGELHHVRQNETDAAWITCKQQEIIDNLHKKLQEIQEIQEITHRYPQGHAMGDIAQIADIYNSPSRLTRPERRNPLRRVMR